MLEQSILIPLDQITGHYQPAMYGKSTLQMFEDAQDSKALRKVATKLQALRNLDVINNQTTIGTKGVLHHKNGDGYISVSDKSNTFFIKPEIVQLPDAIPDDICIVTGCCLFGESNARGMMDTGKELSLVNSTDTNSLR
ncbi:MAG: hypothetical protein ACEQSA_02045 [Weeksellaceae bacterium]